MVEQAKEVPQRENRMADSDIAALAGLISSPRHLHHLRGHPVGQMRLGLGDSRPPPDDIRGRDHHRAGDGREVFIKDARELVVTINASQLRQDESRFPLEDLILVVQTDEEIETGIKHLGTLFADETERFRAAVLDAGLVRVQTPEEFLQPVVMLHRLPGELTRVGRRSAESFEQDSHARDFTIGHLAGQIDTGPGERALRNSPAAGYRAAATGSGMKVEVLGFGEIEVDGERYDHDIVIAAGEVKKRKKSASKRFRDEYGHTPLSAEEDIPWGGRQLIVGTGVYGKLPILPAVEAEAKRRGIKLLAVPTDQACQLLGLIKRGETFAILHVTC